MTDQQTDETSPAESSKLATERQQSALAIESSSKNMDNPDNMESFNVPEDSASPSPRRSTLRKVGIVLILCVC